MYQLKFNNIVSIYRIRIDQTGLKKTFDSYDPDEYQLLEGEERRYLGPESQKVDFIYTAYYLLIVLTTLNIR